MPSPRANSYSDSGPKLLVLASDGRPEIVPIPIEHKRATEVGSEVKSVVETDDKPRFAESLKVETIQPIIFSDSWECDYCTFMNIPSTRICAMCYKAKCERKLEDELRELSGDEDDAGSTYSSNDSIDSQDPKYLQSITSESEHQPKVNEDIPTVAEKSEPQPKVNEDIPTVAGKSEVRKHVILLACN